MKYKAKVIVKLKNTVKDAKGAATDGVLKRIGYEDAANTRVGKYFELEISAQNETEAHKKLENICSDALANPVVETYEILNFDKV